MKSEKQKAIIRARTASIGDDAIAQLQEPVDRIERNGDSLREQYRKFLTEYERDSDMVSAMKLESKIASVFADLKGIVHHG